MEEKGKADGLKEVAKEVIGLEHNKIFTTVKYLTLSPSRLITEYCNGEKNKFLSPVVFFLGVQSIRLYLGSISGLSDYLLKDNTRSVLSFLNSTVPSLAANKNETDRVANDFDNFLSFFNSEIGRQVIGLPILLILAWLFYKKFNHSFKDNSWFALYTWGHASLLSIPFILAFYLTKNIILFAMPANLIFVLYGTWGSMKFYNLNLGKAFTLRILMQFAYFLTLSITGNIFSIVFRFFIG